MSDSVIFTFEEDGELKLDVEDSEKIDGIIGRIAENILDEDTKTEFKSRKFEMIIKCKNSGSENFEDITTIKQLKSDTYRDPTTKKVISQIYLEYPEHYKPPFTIDDWESSDKKYHGIESDNSKAWGYRIVLEAGDTVKILPIPERRHTDFLRWSTLCSDRKSKFSQGGLDLVCRWIAEAYTGCGGTESETYKEKMKNINDLMETRIQEKFSPESTKTRINRINRLRRVFNEKVVDIANLIPDKSFDFKRMISESIQSYCQMKANMYSTKKARIDRQQLREALPYQNPDWVGHSAQGTIGGYREPPRRKKRKNTMRKKRKNTMRKKTKRKNTMRNKRKNTKRKNTKKR